MADPGMQERTERATPKRKSDARKKGQIPRSRELNTAAVTVGGSALLLGLGGGIAGTLMNFFRHGLTLDPALLDNGDSIVSALGQGLASGFGSVVPFLALMMAVALAASLLIGGWNFSPQAVVPDFSKLSPARGLGRIFSGHGLVELLKSLAKVALVGGIAAAAGWSKRQDLQALAGEDVAQGIAHGASLCMHVLLWVGGGLLIIAAIDVPWQIYSYEKQLRMSRQEIRDEYKQSEGRPEVKARIRRVQHEMSRKRMMEKVPKADVIVVNPEHYAVALQYAQGTSRAPVLLAKGVDQMALAIRTLAAEHRIPIVEAPPLARALYRHTELDREIPVSLYTAVAQVLTYVYQLRAYRGGPRPVVPQVGDVPGGEI